MKGSGKSPETAFKPNYLQGFRVSVFFLLGALCIVAFPCIITSEAYARPYGAVQWRQYQNDRYANDYNVTTDLFAQNADGTKGANYGYFGLAGADTQVFRRGSAVKRGKAHVSKLLS